MNHNSPSPISSLLNAEGNRLAGIRARAVALERISRLVRQSLPSSLAPHCVGAFVREKTLIVFVESAAWGARIRFQQTAMLAAVRAAPGNTAPRRVRVKILPPEINPQAQPRAAARRELSTAARRSLHAAANAVADRNLAAALRRLARR